MIQLPVVYGEWSLRDRSWHFLVDTIKGGRLFTLYDGCTHRELVEMAQVDYMLDKKADVELSYPLPDIMLKQMGPDSPPIYVKSDRHVQSMVELAKMHLFRLCVSSRSGMDIGSEKGGMDIGLKEDVCRDSIVKEEDEDDEDDEDEEWKEGDEEDIESSSDGSVCGGDDDAGYGNLDTDERVFWQDAKAYCDDVDYTVYGKVKGEDCQYDEDFKNYELDGIPNQFVGRGGKAWSDGIFLHKCFDSKMDL